MRTLLWLRGRTRLEKEARSSLASRAKVKARQNEEHSMTKWKPIETAPKDGTIVLACAEYDMEEKFGLGCHPMTVRWEVYHPNAPGKGLWRDKNGHKQMHLTHWMPLPKPPSN